VTVSCYRLRRLAGARLGLDGGCEGFSPQIVSVNLLPKRIGAPRLGIPTDGAGLDVVVLLLLGQERTAQRPLPPLGSRQRGAEAGNLVIAHDATS
jgi:hypothetical protein